MPEFEDAIAEAKAMIEGIGRALVDHPEAVAVDVVNQDDSTIFHVRSGFRDARHLIGKQARMARSTRVMLYGISRKHRHRFALEIEDIEGQSNSVSPDQS